MKKIVVLLSSIFMVLFLGGCSEEKAKTIVEDKLDFKELKALSNKTYTLNTTDGKTITLKVENDTLVSEQLKNKVVLINFWATWCPPCKKEIPAFNELYEKYSDKFEIIGVLYEKDKNIDELMAFMNEYKVKFPVTIGEENFRMAKAFDDVKRVPESFVYDANGKFIKKYIGEVELKSLEELIIK